MNFMYQYPDVTGTDIDMLDCGPVAEVAGAAEDAGFMGFAFTEHPAPGNKWLMSGGHQSLDPFVALAYVAAATTRIKLLTYLAVVPYRNPLLLAKSAATVDKLSGGRFVLGVGTGYLKGEFHALGVDFDERNALFDEALDVLPLHWSGAPFSYRGRHFEARDVVGRPLPVQSPIPIWIGGNSMLTRRRVAERAQGWMPLSGTPELFRTTRTTPLDERTELAGAVAGLRAAAGARGPSIDVMVAHTDLGIADRRADLAKHAEQFAAYEAAGATWVMIPGATYTRGDTLDFLERFGSTIIGP
ncbi:MAG TPA: LLM class F420-dependent oxidoreductase [Mycobacteriales bacterium]|nr:LLM class F420-dependent oxidoreductase [Mycobacteriales bacterium]